MNRRSKILSDLSGNDSGATSIEYGMIAACIAVLLIVSIYELGSTLKGTFYAISGALG